MVQTEASGDSFTENYGLFPDGSAMNAIYNLNIFFKKSFNQNSS